MHVNHATKISPRKNPAGYFMRVLVDTRASDDAARFVYAVIAALGMDIVELADANDDASYAATIQVGDNTIVADHSSGTTRSRSHL